MNHSPPREEGRLRHQEIFGEAVLSAADGVVAHTEVFGVSDHPGRSAATPPHEEGNGLAKTTDQFIPGSMRLKQMRPFSRVSGVRA